MTVGRNLAVDATRAMFFLVPGAYCDAPTMSVSGECLELGEAAELAELA